MLKRLVHEYVGLARAMDAASFSAFVAASGINAPEILRSKNLTSADRMMRRPVRFRTWREDITLDCAAIDRATDHFDNSMLFTLARELLGRDVYLRAFMPFSAAGQTVIDLGANRGLFTAIAAAALQPARIVSIEPHGGYQPVFRSLTAAFPADIQWVNAFVGDGDGYEGDAEGASSISIASLLSASERVAMLKADIEGDEESLFKDDVRWLSQVDRITMEAHPECCDMAAVYAVLLKAGLHPFPSDEMGKPTSIDKAMFVYGARNAEDLRPKFRP
jgi:hypothetical protein